jgi:formylglycine-generating enzyme required for sulfatase activity
MEEEGIRVGDFAEFAKDRFENFVERVEMGARIMTDSSDKEVRRILKTKNPLYAWRVFGTLSGRLTDEEAWQSVNQEREGPPKDDWGPMNASRLKGMTGGVWEWAGDWYDRNYYARSPERNPMGPENGGYRGLSGGSWGDDNPGYFRAACRDFDHAGSGDDFIGFRVAAASNFLRKR